MVRDGNKARSEAGGQEPGGEADTEDGGEGEASGRAELVGREAGLGHRIGEPRGGTGMRRLRVGARRRRLWVRPRGEPRRRGAREDGVRALHSLRVNGSEVPGPGKLGLTGERRTDRRGEEVAT